MRKEMRICLAPWDGYKSSGPYLHAKNGRQHINLLTFNGTSKHLNVTYAKYLAAIKYGRIPEGGEEVDHIDGDRTNDTLGNLRIVSREENKRKSLVDPRKSPRKGTFQYTCSFCGKEYEVTRNTAPHLRGSKKAFCSRQCMGFGRNSPEGLVYKDTTSFTKIEYKNKMENWFSFSKEITMDTIIISNNVKEGRKDNISHIVKGVRSLLIPCASCKTPFHPDRWGQKCCSSKCSNQLRYGSSNTTKEELELSLSRIKEGVSTWVAESKKHGISDNGLKGRMIRAGLSVK